MAALLGLGVGLLGRGLLGRPRAACCSNICSGIRRLALDKSPLSPPKRPLNAYVRYMVEQQQILFKQKPDIRVVERTKWIAQAWRQLTADQKHPYQIEANGGKEKYKLDLAAFNAQLTPAELANLKEKKRHKLAKRKTMRQKRKLTMLGKPKRPRTGFNIFMAENFDDAKGPTSTAKLKNLQVEWHQLSDTQKQMYKQLAEDDKIRYRNEIKSWEEQMIETGHEDVIRAKNKKKIRRLPRKKAKSKQTASQTVSTGAKASTLSSTSKTGKEVKKPEE
ncbi:transcription factor A, mitochondrial [Rhinoraja longicauda]